MMNCIQILLSVFNWRHYVEGYFLKDVDMAGRCRLNPG